VLLSKACSLRRAKAFAAGDMLDAGNRVRRLRSPGRQRRNSTVENFVLRGAGLRSRSCRAKPHTRL